jgi:signal transduction histidine kinase
MALAPDPTFLNQSSSTPTAFGPDTQAPEASAAALLELANAAGAGLVRVGLGGEATALNPSGALLLEAIGGSDGGPAPAALVDALAIAALDGFPAVRDASALTPESRHISVVALVRGEEQLVALRDHTEERLLQERLLQSEKMASVGQLVSGVAHELNNPLTAVTGFAQVLLARPDLDPVARVQIQKIYEEGERAAKIVLNLLSFARRRRPAKELTDINVLVARVLELRSYDFGMRNISLDMELERHMPPVLLDPDQIQQVLFNLVKNAEQAMTDANGGGVLTVRSFPGPDGRDVRVSIGDDGPGIPPEVQRRIFDPFFTTKEAGEGTGLGLTISYSIVDEHNGRIRVENRPEGGSVFTIELPAEQPAVGDRKSEIGEDKADNGAPPTVDLEALEEASSSVRPEALEGQAVAPTAGSLRAKMPAPGPEGRNGVGGAEAPRSPRRILVVDDEESIRLLLNDVLTLDGYEAELAATGIEAMEKLLAGSYDVIISDIKMPGMDGATLYRELAARSPAMAARLIFITGDTVSPDTRAFLGTTTAPVLTKPFRMVVLREAIEGVLSAPPQRDG